MCFDCFCLTPQPSSGYSPGASPGQRPCAGYLSWPKPVRTSSWRPGQRRCAGQDPACWSLLIMSPLLVFVYDTRRCKLSCRPCGAGLLCAWHRILSARPCGAVLVGAWHHPRHYYHDSSVLAGGRAMVRPGRRPFLASPAPSASPPREPRDDKLFAPSMGLSLLPAWSSQHAFSLFHLRFQHVPYRS